MSSFLNPAMKQLTAQQVRYSPQEVRLPQIKRAEQLLATVRPDGSYPYANVCQSITGYRSERYPDLVLTGEEALHDLRCFIEDLSDTLELRAEDQDETVLTVDDVGRIYNVSTKTVDRWRSRGLASRRYVVDGRKRIGFPRSAVERFVRTHDEEVRRGARFRQLTSPEREEIIRRARRLARYGGCPQDVSKRLARRMGRSPETIRYTLRNYDRDHPEIAVFPQATGPLSDGQKCEIFSLFRRGVAAEDLAKKFCRTRSSVFRIVSEVRAIRLLEQPIDFMDSPDFVADDPEQVILGAPPETESKGRSARAPSGLPPYLASLYSQPLLTREEEVYHFRKMNYLKFRAAHLRIELNPARPRAREMGQIERLLDGAVGVKNFLIRSNLRLVVSIAKRHIRPNANFFEMVSDGNMSLIRAIEKFDYTKGNKFSTYATWAIMKNFSRSIPQEHTVLDRFRTGHDEVFARSTDRRTNQFQQELINHRQREMIDGILSGLDAREKDIIVHRFGLERGVEPETLEQVGNRLGVTKERIRQLESRALKKLRKVAHDEKLDIPGM